MPAPNVSAANVRAAEVVLPCEALDVTQAFFAERLGFRVDAVFPADDPRVAVMSGHGVRIRLVRGADGAPGRLRLSCVDPAALANGAREIVAPNGTCVELVPVDPPLELPELLPSFTIARAGDGVWIEGRAGMRYRDLAPGRQNGRFIASRIRIDAGGPVPDYVHFHKVRFQMIYCARGWVKVVYEDQGPPFVLRQGDCVLQPPGIRHRVLESSPGLEVIEIGSPADHETFADHELELPTTPVLPERDFGGQRFVRHEAARAAWHRRASDGLEVRDLGIGAATRGVASACVARLRKGTAPTTLESGAEISFLFVLEGGATLRCEGRDPERLSEGDAVVVPPSMRHLIGEAAEPTQLLLVSM